MSYTFSEDEYPEQAPPVPSKFSRTNSPLRDSFSAMSVKQTFDYGIRDTFVPSGSGGRGRKRYEEDLVSPNVDSPFGDDELYEDRSMNSARGSPAPSRKDRDDSPASFRKKPIPKTSNSRKERVEVANDRERQMKQNLDRETREYDEQESYHSQDTRQDNYRNDTPRRAPSLSISHSPPRESCGSCSQLINDISQAFEITVLGKWFHCDCFTCSVCDCVFDENNPFVPHDGRAYCEYHYENEIAGEQKQFDICAACQEPITDDKISFAFGQTFHSRHLRCHICKNRIRGPHVEHNGKAFCEEDYKKLTQSKCAKCRLSIKDGAAVQAIGSVWHRDCFTCVTCSRGFPDKKFFVFEGMPFCLPHYHEASNTICANCMNPIEGACVDVKELRSKFHPECWSCEYCNRVLDGVYFSYQGRAYCEDDIDRVYRGKGGNSRPEKRHTLHR